MTARLRLVRICIFRNPAAHEQYVLCLRVEERRNGELCAPLVRVVTGMHSVRPQTARVAKGTGCCNSESALIPAFSHDANQYQPAKQVLLIGGPSSELAIRHLFFPLDISSALDTSAG